MNFKDVVNKLMGKTVKEGRDEHGLPIRRATVDDRELEQYREEDRREYTKKLLALKRRERLTRFMTYGGYALNIPPPKPLPIEKTHPRGFKRGFGGIRKKGRGMQSNNLFFK